MNLPAIASELPDFQAVDDGVFRVLSVGRFVPLKGFDVTLRAFAAFYRRQDEGKQRRLELVLIGRGPERQRLQAIAEGERLPAHAVRWVDWVERAELPRFFASASAFLFPTHEGGGMVLAEAMGFGLPVLCFDHPGPGEYVDETCGLRVPRSLGYEGAVAAFAEGLHRLLHDGPWREQLAEGARLRHARHFTWEGKAERIAGIYGLHQPPPKEERVSSRTPSIGGGWGKPQKIVAVHLLNDFSGSPLVLSVALRCFSAAGMEVELLASAGGRGFLSGIEGVRYRPFRYRFFEGKALRTLALLWSQAQVFAQVLRNARRHGTVVYVNTLLPFGAALAGRLIGKRVVYHLHEATVNPPFLKFFLRKIAMLTASEAIYVSRFLMQQEGLAGVPARVVHNCLPQGFVEKAEAYLAESTIGRGPAKPGVFTVLMLCSLKEYKGTGEFVRLAGLLPDLRFVLVLNAGYDSILRHFGGQPLPENLVLFPAQNDVHSFYREAHLVVNLSHPEQWVETFGMTLLEAMRYGLPVIAPPVGGPTELVEDGFNGYRVDQRNLPLLAERVRLLVGRSGLYRRLSANARAVAGRFSEERFGAAVVGAMTT